jgi:hypothetical protein
MLRATSLVGFGGRHSTSAAAKVLTYQTNASDGADLTTYTFSSQAIGTAAADRYVIVGVGGANTGSNPSSVTIGGVSATNVVQTNGGIHSGSLWIALVPTGTTANIVVVWPSGLNRCGIGVWSATGLSGTAANDTASSNASPGSATVATLAGGFAIGYAFIGYAGTGVSWTNLTGRFAVSVEAGISNSGADVATVGGNLAVTATYTSTYFEGTTRPMVVAAW